MLSSVLGQFATYIDEVCSCAFMCCFIYFFICIYLLSSLSLSLFIKLFSFEILATQSAVWSSRHYVLVLLIHQFGLNFRFFSNVIYRHLISPSCVKKMQCGRREHLMQWWQQMWNVFIDFFDGFSTKIPTFSTVRFSPTSVDPDAVLRTSAMTRHFFTCYCWL